MFKKANESDLSLPVFAPRQRCPRNFGLLTRLKLDHVELTPDIATFDPSLEKGSISVVGVLNVLNWFLDSESNWTLSSLVSPNNRAKLAAFFWPPEKTCLVELEFALYQYDYQSRSYFPSVATGGTLRTMLTTIDINRNPDDLDDFNMPLFLISLGLAPPTEAHELQLAVSAQHRMTRSWCASAPAPEAPPAEAGTQAEAEAPSVQPKQVTGQVTGQVSESAPAKPAGEPEDLRALALQVARELGTLEETSSGGSVTVGGESVTLMFWQEAADLEVYAFRSPVETKEQAFAAVERAATVSWVRQLGMNGPREISGRFPLKSLSAGVIRQLITDTARLAGSDIGAAPSSGPDPSDPPIGPILEAAAAQNGNSWSGDANAFSVKVMSDRGEVAIDVSADDDAVSVSSKAGAVSAATDLRPIFTLARAFEHTRIFVSEGKWLQVCGRLPRRGLEADALAKMLSEVALAAQVMAAQFCTAAKAAPETQSGAE